MPTPKYPPPKDSRDWPEPVVSAFYSAFGEFLRAFAETEAGLLFMVDRYAGGLLAEDVNQATPPTEFWGRTRLQMNIVRALVGSPRSAVIADTIKLLMRVADRQADERQIADEALAQFAHIGIIRNRLVHSSASPFYDETWLFRTGNALEVKERTKAKDYVFSIEDLEKMVADLRSIRLRIGAVTVTDTPSFQNFANANGAFEPWLYHPIEGTDPERTQQRIRDSGHPVPLSPFEAEFSIAASYTITPSGPLAYSGAPRAKNQVP